MNGVNLDAFIKRDDFRVADGDGEGVNFELSREKVLQELEVNSTFFALLRKPDFQRETVYWEPNKVCNLIENFLDGDLIPAVILWTSPNNLVFILDGAHRLSTLAAWVNDDYGDGDITRKYYGHEIPDIQLKLAQKTRNIIDEKIGKYKELKHYNINKKNDTKAVRAKTISLRKIDIQWLKGKAEKAEEAFFRINQNSARLSKTELELLQNRYSPLTISARAIQRKGTGHKYWENFDEDKQKMIEELASKINKILFEPSIKSKVIDTTELPIGGPTLSHKSLTMICDLVKIINDQYDFKNLDGLNAKSAEWEQLSLFEDKLFEINQSITEDDLDGRYTVDVLNRTYKLLSRINSKQAISLGLSPFVYLYSHRTGNFQVTSLLALVEFTKFLENNSKLNDFVKVRNTFEKIIIENNSFIEQTVTKYGSGMKGYRQLNKIYITMLEALIGDKSQNETLKIILKKFDYLKLREEEKHSNTVNFPNKVKSARYIEDILSSSYLRCNICNGHIVANNMTYDHAVRRRDGGLGTLENAQLAHPYCNSAFKN